MGNVKDRLSWICERLRTTEPDYPRRLMKREAVVTALLMGMSVKEAAAYAQMSPGTASQYSLSLSKGIAPASLIEHGPSGVPNQQSRL